MAATRVDGARDALEAASSAITPWTGATDPGFGWPSEARRTYDRLLDRFAAIEERHVDLLMIVGNHQRAAIGFARQLVDRQPFREQRWGLLMLALYRAGRRRDALSVFGTRDVAFSARSASSPGRCCVALRHRSSRTTTAALHLPGRSRLRRGVWRPTRPRSSSGAGTSSPTSPKSSTASAPGMARVSWTCAASPASGRPHF